MTSRPTGDESGFHDETVVCESAQFRLQKVKMLMRVESLDSKEREFVVVSVKPRGENSADASPARVNHLQ